MKTIVALSLLILSGTLAAGEIQQISGDEAYQTYLKLPGVACQEYRVANYIVFSKYQTKNCNESQTDSKKWSCTTQFEIKGGKKTKVLSADCSREIN